MQPLRKHHAIKTALIIAFTIGLFQGCRVSNEQQKVTQGCATETSNLKVMSVNLTFERDRINPLSSASTHPNYINDLVRRLYENRSLWEFIKLRGHADASGLTSFNYGLSIRRAYAVKIAMILAGAQTEDIKIVGLGPDFPIDYMGSTELMNRRVEIFFAGVTDQDRLTSIIQEFDQDAIITEESYLE